MRYLVLVTLAVATTYYTNYLGLLGAIQHRPTVHAQKLHKSAENKPDVPCSEYYNLVNQYDWPSETMMEIMQAESSCRPNAHNFSHVTRDNSHGLLQVNLYGNLKHSRPSADWLRVPENNIKEAYRIYQGQGFSAWATTCATKVRCHD